MTVRDVTNRSISMEDVREVETPHVADTRHYTGNTSVLSQVNAFPQAPVPSNGERTGLIATSGSRKMFTTTFNMCE
jgi:hypothetical protein